jgi:hypothetical protein
VKPWAIDSSRKYGNAGRSLSGHSSLEAYARRGDATTLFGSKPKAVDSDRLRASCAPRPLPVSAFASPSTSRVASW